MATMDVETMDVDVMDMDGMRSRLNVAGQEHLMSDWEKKTPQQQRELYHTIKNLDLEEVCGYFKRAMSGQSEEQGKLDDRLQPIPADAFGSVARSTTEQLRRYRDIGLEAVAKGQIGVLLLAGGQGTRLGVNYPKGMYDVGLPSHKTLYQLQAERLLKLQELAAEHSGVSGGSVAWYIMASESTRQPTVDFFEENEYFGLNQNNLVFFEQGTLPCFNFDGKIIMQTPSSLAHAPDGNGGLYRALKREKILEDMKKRKIQYLHVYCVDNILVKMADPVFMGYCISRGADCGAKVVEKTVPMEPVGVFCQVDGKYQVVEYSEITLQAAQRRNPDGRLTFSAANIVNHFFRADFLDDLVREREGALLHHIAKKKIPYVDEFGKTVKPEKPNGIKMEKFVFDVFQISKNFAVWESLREDEFSPLKNADGAEKDTPTTARLALCSLHQRYVLAAGGQFVDEDGQPIPLIPSPVAIKGSEANNNEAQKGCMPREVNEVVLCEVSPLVSYDGEGLELVRGKRFVAPLLLNDPDQLINGLPLNEPAQHVNGHANGHAINGHAINGH